jgi:hypothetical protein
MSYLFLIGAPKCGTSSLFNHLSRCDKILGTDPKETYALLGHTHPMSTSASFRGMQELLKHWDQRFVASGLTAPLYWMEGTTHNVVSPEAMAEIATLGSDVKIVVMLRQPSQRILSSFMYTKNNLARVSRKLCFNTYVELLLQGDKREICKLVSHHQSGPILADELFMSDYATILRPWLAAFGNHSVYSIISEEFYQNTASELSKLSRWLSLPEREIQGPLEARNPTRRIGSKSGQRAAMRINEFLPRRFRPRILKRVYFRLQNLLARNEVEATEQGIRQLDCYFQPKIDRLESLLGRSIPQWNIEKRRSFAASQKNTVSAKLGSP